MITMLNTIAQNGIGYSSSKTALIAEDNYLSYFILSAILKKNGVNILWAKNGLEAIEQLKLNNAIDIVFMDINMPEMDGLEATKQIKSLRKNLPVVMQTANTDMLKQSVDAGCDDFITKPYDKNLIKSIINKHLGNCSTLNNPLVC